MEERAGIASFSRFGYYNTVNALAKGDITRWDAILLMPYNKVLTKLLMNKVEAAYNKKYDALYKASL